MPGPRGSGAKQYSKPDLHLSIRIDLPYIFMIEQQSLSSNIFYQVCIIDTCRIL